MDNICQLLDQNCKVEAVIFAEHLVCFEFSFGIDELKKRREYDYWILGRLENQLHFFHNLFINQFWKGEKKVIFITLGSDPPPKK